MGAESGTRTRDLLITNELLYQLSYFGIAFLVSGSKYTCYFRKRVRKKGFSFWMYF